MWLSLCITRLFVLHYSVPWDHLWSLAQCSQVTLMNNYFVLSVVWPIIVCLLKWKLFLINMNTHACRHTQQFAVLLVEHRWTLLHLIWKQWKCFQMLFSPKVSFIRFSAFQIYFRPLIVMHHSHFFPICCTSSFSAPATLALLLSAIHLLVCLCLRFSFFSSHLFPTFVCIHLSVSFKFLFSRDSFLPLLLFDCL